MALLGAQLVITLIMVSIIQKIGSHYSLARWLLCSTGLYRFLYPTDEELKSLSKIPKDKPKKKSGKSDQNGKAETFHVPRSLDIELETAKISTLDVVHLRYYTEYQWLVDFSTYSLMVYVISEMYHGVFPLKDDINLSMVWCFLVMGFAFKLLVTLTAQYFRGDQSIGERSTCICAGCAFLLIAMLVLIIDEKNLETGLDNAYQSFYDGASKFLDNQGMDSSGPASKLILKLCLAVWCAVIGALFTFPGLRLAHMHWDALRYSKENKLMSAVLHLNFAMPFILILFWVRPVTRDYLTVRIFNGMDKPLLTTEAFDSLRLCLVVGAVVLRLSLMPTYLQAYLNMAHHRLQTQKKEAGRITNIELQKKIAAVFYYLCVVSLQYVCPLIMCLYLTLMYKTLGGYTWTGMIYESHGVSNSSSGSLLSQVPSDSEGADTTILESAQHFQLAMESIKSIFSETVFRGVLGFGTWWCCFSWFAASSLGMLYHSYFRDS